MELSDWLVWSNLTWQDKNVVLSVVCCVFKTDYWWMNEWMFDGKFNGKVYFVCKKKIERKEIVRRKRKNFWNIYYTYID